MQGLIHWTIKGLVILVVVSAGTAKAARCPAENPTVRFLQDYSHAIGQVVYAKGDCGTQSNFYRWRVNEAVVASGPVSEPLLLHFDGSLEDAAGRRPLMASGIAYAPGKWGQALSLAPGGVLAFDKAGMRFDEMTIEMWVAPREEGSSAVYSNSFNLFQYYSPNDDSLSISHDGANGVIYAGSEVNGNWQSAYDVLGNSRKWKAGEWHHIALVLSASHNSIRLFIDGELRGDTNEGGYVKPSADGLFVTLGGSEWGQTAAYDIDDFRIVGRVLADAEIAKRARNPDPFGSVETWLPATAFGPGDLLAYEILAPNASGVVTVSSSPAYPYRGIPLADAEPPSMLLPSGTMRLPFAIRSLAETECRYSIGEALPYESMIPFDTGAGSTVHRTELRGLDPDPNTVNEVYIRCAADPDYAYHVRYRCLSDPDPAYPRTGNIWGREQFRNRDMAYCSKIDLWLGSTFTPDEIRELRGLNPDVQVLTAISALESLVEAPDEYYLKDVNGHRIELWPSCPRLNVTRPEVAEFLAQQAYQLILDNDLMFDGCFFDNVHLTQSWVTRDVYGNEVAVDADGDGVADDPAVLDAAWRSGVLRVLQSFRRLMPYAVASCHTWYYFDPELPKYFNGLNVGFLPADIIEGKASYGDLRELSALWNSTARSPVINMIESAPPDQIAYGYGFLPWEQIPASSIEFGRTYYPNVRFGLASALIEGHYFAHEFGDAWHGNDWWYDELDFNLGYPKGPAESIDVAGYSAANMVVNAGFENILAYPWYLYAESGCAATVTRDGTDKAVGSYSAKIKVTATGGRSSQVEFEQFDLSLEKGQEYEVSFWAKADAARPLSLATLKGIPDWRCYGLDREVALDTTWKEYKVSFIANETASDARIQFWVGRRTGTVWIDEVRVTAVKPNLFRREFDHGLVLLNATPRPQTVRVGPGYRRLSGSQSPRYEIILDDDVCTVTGDSLLAVHDTGELQPYPPYYHDWGPSCRELRGSSSEARWVFTAPEADTYVIKAWWPAAPSTNAWSRSASYELLVDDSVVDRVSYDQNAGGDEWHILGSVPLARGESVVVVLRAADGKTCLVDALYVQSSARFNDGSPADEVVLQPMDGIILERVGYSAPADRDSDGMSDAWEKAYSGSTTKMMAERDDDGDGLSNFSEYIAGTDPNDFRSSFDTAAGVKGISGNVFFLEIGPPTTNSRIYDISWSSNLVSSSWISCGLNLRGRDDGGSLIAAVTNDSSAVYFRATVRVEG